ncbi:Putative thioredoxin-like, metaxin, glutathione S-transferase domain-containing protein [Colletotrichum destructivum]|uniref:Thioredoxin-like, metaxin, glutathione S-transferase domain-containing protein n=1 Tax=Colletotrichum destructivum TaxID=34406 RepID=A0AAX4IZT4_9PEZI|nr:Putative thioredoxin-like, metaxin, glutathione S-transferase domain-containing protein [Colletotrichum destructivum]
MSDHARSWFAVPAPVAALFRRFPLAVYPANDLPLRSPSRAGLPTLYVFVADDDAPRGRPSFNPSCLKWQTFLKIAGVEFRILPSTNHASPSGALPYLQPPSPLRPVAGAGRLEAYALDNSLLPAEKRPPPPAPSDRLRAYESLLDTRLRTAWLHALYLAPDNAPLLSRLYLRPASSSPLVRLALAHQVRSAAEAEVLKSTRSALVDPVRIYADARAALEALAALLDENTEVGEEDGPWFFSSPRPTLFDASVFAYTHLLLDGDFGWLDSTLPQILSGFPGLVRHRERLLERCFPDDEGVLV